LIFHAPDVNSEHIEYLRQEKQQQLKPSLLYVREPFESLSWLLRNTSLALLFDYTMTYQNPPILFCFVVGFQF
jgi:hypothetical protein